MTLDALIEQAAALFARSSGAAAQITATALHSINESKPGDTAGRIKAGEQALEPPPELTPLLASNDANPVGPCVSILSKTYCELGWFASGRAESAAYAQIVGPGSRYHHDHVRVGLFLLPANYHYANHVHGADEIYIVVGGRGDWSIDSGRFVEKSAGDTIEIPSMTVHAIRTHQDPALILWSWTGDITLDRYRFTDL